MAHLREAIRHAPDDFRAHQNLGNLLAKHGRDEEAVGELGQALRLNSDDPEIYVALGFAQGRRGNLAAAQACFQKALVWTPPTPRRARVWTLCSNRARGQTRPRVPGKPSLDILPMVLQ